MSLCYPTSAAHDWQDSISGIKPTPGCERCEARQRKLARIAQLREENKALHSQAFALGLVDDDE